MKNRYNLALIHPPSIYDFREKPLHYGPVSDVIPSSSIFDLYPIGFLSTLTYLVKKGFNVRIVNLAANMLLNTKFDVQKAVKELEADIYGIDLHWLPHVQGAIEIAKIVKRLHPEKKVVLGGMSSTVFWREILNNYLFIDFILLGDTTEIPMEILLESVIESKHPLKSIPNIAWREKNGRIRSNDITFIPRNLDEFSIDYGVVIKESIRRNNSLLSVPFAKFISEPIGASLSYKGCIHNCITCGGSKFSFNCFFKRDKLGIKSPKKIFEEIKSLSDYMRIPIFLLGDLQLIGERRIKALIKMLSEEKIDNTLLFEFFYPPSKRILSLIRKSTDRVIIHLSPETQDEEVRFTFGKKYDNRQLFKFIHNALDLKVDRLDLYFMVGLPKQDYDSSLKIPEFIEQLLNRFRKAGKINFFSAPLAPFLDPGSKVFTDPKTYGYNLILKNLEEHKNKAFLSENWKNSLNYETVWMSRDEIVNATYDVSKEILRIKINNGIIEEDKGLRAIEMIQEIREIVNSDKSHPRKIAQKETVTKGDLYPTKNLLLTAKPKLLLTLTRNLMKR
ncbi:TIGR04190 family B12-binding domain/radical SAM domain protein [[Eubacterium] cellulosolvens]